MTVNIDVNMSQSPALQVSSNIVGGNEGAITTEQIDSVIADESPEGSESLRLTGLSYLYSKLKTVFASITHDHTILGVDSNSNPSIRFDATKKSVAEGGYGANATGSMSHAEGGSGATASGNSSHAEGAGTTASGYAAHVEGTGNTASGYAAHAEGGSVQAISGYSHAEGYNTYASGENAHAEGSGTKAKSANSHAEGMYTEAASMMQHVAGKYNVVDEDGVYAEIIGNGSNLSNRANARTLDWQGNEWLAGGLTFHDSNGNTHTLDNILQRIAALEG